MRSHVHLLRFAAPLVGALALALAPLAPAGAQVPVALVATWEGDARIVNSALDACRPGMRITIDADGTVQGMVGEARLVRGRLRRDRGALGRFFHVKSDWVIDAGLDGPILSSESVRRERIRIPFDVEEFELRGALRAEGGGAAVTARFVLRKS